MEHIGVSVHNDTSNELVTKCNRLQAQIKRILTKHGAEDDEWAQAISAQYFLLSLAKDMQTSKKIYYELLNKCLSSFSITYKGDYVLDKDKILITPDETHRIIECMKQEDEENPVYARNNKLNASKINTQQMYMNFHYGLLLRIVASEDTKVLRALKHVCLDKLLDDNALDASDGWYPYRVPWLTARVLISLKNVDYSDYDKADKLNEIIQQAIESLYQRFDESEMHWRSGVGQWVSKWESTALCLEALYLWDEDNLVKQLEMKKAVAFIFSEQSVNDWLETGPNFGNADESNATLSSVCLASVVYRITAKYFVDYHKQYSDRILNYFATALKKLSRLSKSDVRQYCTIPQILYYIASAIDE